MASLRKLKILLFAQTPPSYHGFTLMNRILLDSPFMQALDVTTQSINFAERIEDIGGKFSVKKVGLSTYYYFFQIISTLLVARISHCIHLISFSTTLLQIDTILLGAVRFFAFQIYRLFGSRKYHLDADWNYVVCFLARSIASSSPSGKVKTTNENREPPMRNARRIAHSGKSLTSKAKVNV